MFAHWLKHNIAALIVALVVIAAVAIAVRRLRTAGRLSVVAAQAMDMSEMHPPTGPAPVSLGVVRRGPTSDTVTYTGTIAPLDEQAVAPRVSGIIVSLPVYPGDRVRAGEVVAELDTAEVGAEAARAAAQAQSAREAAQVAILTHRLHHTAQLEIAQAQEDAASAAVSSAQARARSEMAAAQAASAAVASARASDAYWRAEIIRESQLAQAGAVSQQDYESEQAKAAAASAQYEQARDAQRQAEESASAGAATVRQASSDLAAARGQVAMARAEIAIAQGEARQAAATAQATVEAARAANVVLGYARITAPLSGVVVARTVAPGNLVQPGQPILTIDEIDRVRVQANVAVADLGRIHAGTTVAIEVQDGRATAPFPGLVSTVFPAADPSTRTAVVEADVPNPDDRLLPGEFVSMTFGLRTAPDALLIPTAALVGDAGRTAVWVARSGAPARVYVCVICHIHYSAAQAARFGYRDPMDGGQLVPLTSSGAGSELHAYRVPVTVRGSDGKWSSIAPGSVAPGEQVVVRGKAGLSESDLIAPVTWDDAGPATLPPAPGSSPAGQAHRSARQESS